MCKGIAHWPTAVFHQQRVVGGRMQIVSGYVREQHSPLKQRLYALGQPHLWVFQQCRVNADVRRLPARAHTIMPFARPFVQIHGGRVIEVQELWQAAAVVIVAMGKDRQIHLGQIHPQLFGIAQEHSALPHIK